MLWQLILGHILLIAGVYFTAWGINVLLVGTATPADIFGKPLFWGLFAILGAFCFFLPAMVISIKAKGV